tara:strand:- start:2170 stop:3903 length:1734 start_codon:yes stop_codon:yes gene_type:complete
MDVYGAEGIPQRNSYNQHIQEINQGVADFNSNLADQINELRATQNLKSSQDTVAKIGKMYGGFANTFAGARKINRARTAIKANAIKEMLNDNMIRDAFAWKIGDQAVSADEMLHHIENSSIDELARPVAKGGIGFGWDIGEDYDILNPTYARDAQQLAGEIEAGVEPLRVRLTERALEDDEGYRLPSFSEAEGRAATRAEEMFGEEAGAATDAGRALRYGRQLADEPGVFEMTERQLQPEPEPQPQSAVEREEAEGMSAEAIEGGRAAGRAEQAADAERLGSWVGRMDAGEAVAQRGATRAAAEAAGLRYGDSIVDRLGHAMGWGSRLEGQGRFAYLAGNYSGVDAALEAADAAEESARAAAAEEARVAALPVRQSFATAELRDPIRWSFTSEASEAAGADRAAAEAATRGIVGRGTAAAGRAAEAVGGVVSGMRSGGIREWYSSLPKAKDVVGVEGETLAKGARGAGAIVGGGYDVYRDITGDFGEMNAIEKIGNVMNIGGSTLEVAGLAGMEVPVFGLAAELVGGGLAITGTALEMIGEAVEGGERDKKAIEDEQAQAQAPVTTQQTTVVAGRSN